MKRRIIVLSIVLLLCMVGVADARTRVKSRRVTAATSEVAATFSFLANGAYFRTEAASPGVSLREVEGGFDVTIPPMNVHSVEVAGHGARIVSYSGTRIVFATEPYYPPIEGPYEPPIVTLTVR